MKEPSRYEKKIRTSKQDGRFCRFVEMDARQRAVNDAITSFVNEASQGSR